MQTKNSNHFENSYFIRVSTTSYKLRALLINKAKKEMPKGGKQSKDISINKIGNPTNPRVLQHIGLTSEGFEVV